MDMNMTPAMYTDLASRTDTDSFSIDRVPFSTVLFAVEDVLAAAKAIDAIKKSIFYRRDTQLPQYPERTSIEGSPYEDADIESVNSHLFHAALGFITEGAEFLDLVMQQACGGLDDPRQLPLELGDMAWYTAQAVKALEVSHETVWEMNIEKLRRRFPYGFSYEAANTRDVHAEEQGLTVRKMSAGSVGGDSGGAPY